ncbi:uncharacterized protein LOC114353977 [Ostrinia furnacalis]|uniref:uncharacterized protein LOC114353977 n=1 Tax=Ostrinia furnacalis TaxID=93504 RepID=UPI00103915A8|nr:uncharacterized protein LOC114353977 [Ostrinia furnacalis]
MLTILEIVLRTLSKEWRNDEYPVTQQQNIQSEWDKVTGTWNCGTQIHNSVSLQVVSLADNLLGPEVDDLDMDERPETADTFHGIDDGLLEPIDKTPEIFGNGDVDKKELDPDDPHATSEDGVGASDGKWEWPPDETDYPYDIGNRFGADDRPISPIPGINRLLSAGIQRLSLMKSPFQYMRLRQPRPAQRIPSIPDVNTYQQKKNLAQGMMDLALLSANANQLRYVIESSSAGHPYYYLSVVFISLSIILQVAVGVGLIMNSRYNVKEEKDICKADKINNMTVLGIFLITIVNVFIASFSVGPVSTNPAPIPIQQAG